jgi:hypothetical protein
LTDFINTFVTETDKVPSPRIFRLWSAITTVSGALERKVWTTGAGGAIYPNLFTLLVGPPASGKTMAIRQTAALWRKLKGLHLSPDNVTKASLIDVLSRSMRTVMNGSTTPYIFSALAAPVSEFGVFFTHYDMEFLSTLTHIYDSPPFHSEERRTTGKVEINKPHLVMLAGTQPDFLATFLPSEAWGQGFTSRLIMIYASRAPQFDIFSPISVNADQLVPILEQIFSLKGEFVWTRSAAEELNTWNRANCPPTPQHSKLLNYNGRRALHTVKLAMISSASRSPELVITVEDFERAKDWLLQAEKTMPDIFASMNQRSDAQVIQDLHYHLYQIYSRVALDKRKPVTEKDVYSFLQNRVPSDRILRIIEVAEKSGHLRRGPYPGEWIPRPLNEVKDVTNIEV